MAAEPTCDQLGCACIYILTDRFFTASNSATPLLQKRLPLNYISQGMFKVKLNLLFVIHSDFLAVLLCISVWVVLGLHNFNIDHICTSVPKRKFTDIYQKTSDLHSSLPLGKCSKKGGKYGKSFLYMAHSLLL